MTTTDLRLRPMTVPDLVTAAAWLGRPHVCAWWGDEVEEWCAEARGALEAGRPSVYRLAELDGRPVGLIFRYRVHDYAEYAEELAAAGVGVPTGAWSMDYLIGEESATGIGAGSAMIRRACTELWCTEPTATCVVVPVHAGNERSWRALLRSGFTRLPGTYDLEPDVPGHDRRHVVCRALRPEASDGPGD